MFTSLVRATKLFLVPWQEENSVEPRYAPLVEELKRWIYADPVRRNDFESGIRTARSHNTSEMRDITSLEDYLAFLNSNLTWTPSEAIRPKDLLVRLTTMWFVLDQPSVIGYQSAIRPTIGIVQPDGSDSKNELTWLSAWMIRYSNGIGKFMDTPQSARDLDTFMTSPSYNMADYTTPRGGVWRTFNEFFARQLKPGRRPIAAIGDRTVVTSPADFAFIEEAHTISCDSTITTKGMTWSLAQMLAQSPYAGRFADGVWLHGFLDVDDYHHVHAPLAGRVVEARVIPGMNYMLVEAKSSRIQEDGVGQLVIPNETGYQFYQSRGLIVLDTGSGLVAVLPVGMAIVSSVILTAEVGAELHKGEELGYFQFGGSDVVLVFEARMGVDISMEKGRHYRMGSEIGRVRNFQAIDEKA
ncbi:phosphatidylserine decarboxylase-domain-containing protein [Aspergillus pseudoustus]|uniref:Phosphatidylserine decarboxylase-domain-containing protein n=1 Tax=Aspergillus pseudoustus TaxID=1810923 RepID=A0ABR4I9Y9_9EURO